MKVKTIGKVVSVSNTNNGGEALIQALSAMSEAFNILFDWGSDFTASLTSPGNTPFDFSDVRDRFARVGGFTSLLIQSHDLNIQVNGAQFEKHIDWIDDNLDKTTKICSRLYAREGVSEEELEQAYHLHDEFCTALGNLITVFNKIKNGEITVNWIEKVPKLPEWKVPAPFNRKAK